MKKTKLILSRATKAMLRRELRRVTKQRNEFARQLCAITPEVIPYTITEPVTVGETIMVRVPKPFISR